MEDNNIAILEQRVHALEIGKQYEANKEAVRKVEEECLLKLRQIKAAILEEQNKNNAMNSIAGLTTTTTTKTTDNAISSTLSSSTELDTLRSENMALKQKITKLEYRVQHLVTNIDALLPTTV